MKKISASTFQLLAGLLLIMTLNSCEEIQEELKDLQKAPTPTKNLMLGVWEVTEAYDISNPDSTVDITEKIKVLFTGFHLSSDNGVNSTAGPMVTYLVYGPNKWTEILSSLNQVFDYAKAVVSDEVNLNTGEFFIGKEEQDRFTLEMKLEGVAGSSFVDNILSLFSIEQDLLSPVIYHRFRDVRVDINENQPDMMVWTFDNLTNTYYFTKNEFGDNSLWAGIDFPFRNCEFVLRKKSKSLIDIVKETSEASSVN